MMFETPSLWELVAQIEVGMAAFVRIATPSVT